MTKQTKPTFFLLSFLMLLLLPVCAVEAGSHRIQIDVDRNIYPSQDPAFEYQANAKMLSVYFNQRKEKDKAWTLGIWVCANPEPKDWWHHHKTSTYAFFDLPQTDDYTVKDSMITYHYKDIDIQFEILLDKVQRTIIVKSPQAIEHLASYLKYNAIFNNLLPKALDSRRLGLDDGKDSGLYVQTMKIRDSSRTKTKIFSRNKKKKQRYAYITAHSQRENVHLNNDILELEVDWEWLRDKDRVFPVYINDNLEGEASLTGYGGWTDNETNLVDDDTETICGTECVGDSLPDCYLDIDLGGLYDITGFSVQAQTNYQGLCDNIQNTAHFQLQKKNNGGYDDISGCSVSSGVEKPWTYFKTKRTANCNESSIRYLRITAAGSTIGQYNMYNNGLAEIEIYGTAAAELETIVDTPHSGKFTNGLVGYWSFDGANMDWSQTTAEARDQSGQGNHGDVIGPTVTIGKVGQALDFDGGDDYVNMGDPAGALEIAGSLTMSFWLYSPATPAGTIPTFVGYPPYPSSSVAGYRASYFTSQSKVYFEVDDGDTDRDYVNMGTIDAGQWTQYVGVYDHSAKTMKTYKNGSFVSDTDYNGPPNDGIDGIGTPYGSGNFEIGHNVFGAYIDGAIDEVRIYNRALSAEEVMDLYQAGARKFQVNTPITYKLTDGLVGNWTFNGEDISGVTAYDRSGQGNNGTLTNGPTAVIGKVGQALDFDGSDDYVDIPYVNLDSALTYSFWFKREGSGNIHPLAFMKTLVRITDTQINYWPDIDIGGELKSWTADSDWHHLAIAQNGTSYGLYLDGQDIGDGIANSINTTDENNYIGKWNGGGEWNGLIDEVRIYNRALSAEEILELYKLGTRKFQPN